MYNKQSKKSLKAISSASIYKIVCDESGQALLISALLLLTLSAFVVTTLEIPKFVNKKIKLQTAADAASYSAAIWQARMLNAIALMNDGIAVAYSAIAAATGAMIADPTKIPQMLKIIKRSWKTIKNLSDAQEKLLKSAPIIVLSEVNRVAKANGADMVLTWSDHDSPIPQLNLKRLKGKRSPLIRKGGSEHLGVVAVKNSQQRMPLIQRLLKRDFDRKIIAISQAHVIPDPSGNFDMFKANFDAELEPVKMFDRLLRKAGIGSEEIMDKVILH